ncbi:MAG: 3-hydroxyacyl-CoA dehydrogenase NAD-binding domain-containing protein [Candidatus Hydrogenedentota bacterium]
MIEFRKIGVIGGGNFGRGIAQTASSVGLNVIIMEKDASGIEISKGWLIQEMDIEINKWGMTESDKKAILSRIEYTLDWNKFKDIDIVIESVPELFEVKVKSLINIERVISEKTVIATNCATLSITELASKLSKPERLIGVHFHYPVVKRPLVEIVRGLKTTQETFEIARALIKVLKKESVEVFEYPGYITTRAILPFLNEAMHIVMEGVASVENVDKAMKLAYDLKIGPLELADQIGLEKVLFWMEHLFGELGEAKYRACPILRKMVRAGHLGVKTGIGFYRYKDGKKETIK